MVLAIQGLLGFHTNFGTSCSSSGKNHLKSENVMPLGGKEERRKMEVKEKGEKASRQKERKEGKRKKKTVFFMEERTGGLV